MYKQHSPPHTPAFSLCSQHTGLDTGGLHQEPSILFPNTPTPKLTYVCDFTIGAQDPLVLNVKEVTKTIQSALQKTQKCGHGYAVGESWTGVGGKVSPSFSLLIMSSCNKSQTLLNHRIFSWQNALHVSHQKQNHHTEKEEYQLIFLCD